MDGQEVIKRECGKRCAIETCIEKYLELNFKGIMIHLIESMPKHIQACVKAHGGHAKY